MSTILTALAVVAAATPGLLMTPAELAAAAKDPAVAVVTIADTPADFEAGHIPGAEFTGADGGMGGMHVAGHLPGARQLVWNADRPAR